VQGCWEHFKDKHHRPFADAGDMAHWQQLYRKAGGSLPEERRPESTNRNAAPGPIADSETPEPPAGQLPPAQPTAFPQPPRNHHRRTTRLITGVAAALTFLMLGVLAGTHIAASQRSGSSQNPLTRSTPGQPYIRVLVTAPSPTCGLMAQDGLRSPATTGFSNVTQVISVGLDSVSAAIMQGTFNGTVYDWLVSHPAGTRAGIQLRWERIPGHWHYCTATDEGGPVAALPGQVATIAVPATQHGAQVTFQACVWHQHPYTARCSNLHQNSRGNPLRDFSVGYRYVAVVKLDTPNVVDRAT
jgi:hypothetical protein